MMWFMWVFSVSNFKTDFSSGFCKYIIRYINILVTFLNVTFNQTLFLQLI